ncbi:DNA-binding response regulator, partial [[Clostridium] scindens]|nr:DNA-binding response regulator [[Clostridium] scindens]
WEKVEALDLGADDYVTKPFHINELLARVRVALRKKTPRVVKEKVFVLDGLRVDFEKYKVYVEDKEVHLTPIEFKLL